MWEPVFTSIINFAIGKEYESGRLYHELAALQKQYASLFRELAQDEIVHAQKLEDLRLERKTLDLPRSIAVEHGVTATFPKTNFSDFQNLHDILAFAVEEEGKAIRLYRDMAARAHDPDLKSLFTFLSEEEREHWEILRKKFEKI